MGKYDRIDKFGIEKMEKAEYQKRQDYVLKKCKCPACPTYVAGDAPTGYCFPLIGTSKKIQWEKDCVCQTCAIYKEYELTHTFYCTRCSQVCQALKVEGISDQGGGG
ncbi:MAG: hypothetical protein A2X99_11305 [Deltaproteobacteria bacterium GWB2_55_19]|nr:MAG: hypothetical protein A2X99_11305 [Deltaproteobacteria bacterium GWB2_55_19]